MQAPVYHHHALIVDNDAGTRQRVGAILEFVEFQGIASCEAAQFQEALAEMPACDLVLLGDVGRRPFGRSSGNSFKHSTRTSRCC
jgi:Flagellar regulatory protein FleQ